MITYLLVENICSQATEEARQLSRFISFESIFKMEPTSIIGVYNKKVKQTVKCPEQRSTALLLAEEMEGHESKGRKESERFGDDR